MKKIDLMEYVKRTKDPSVTDEYFVRFKIKKLEDGKLILVRNMVDRQIDNGALSMSPILNRKGEPVVINDVPVGIVSVSDVEKMLNGASVPVFVGGEDFQKFGWTISNLAGSELEYSTITNEEMDMYDFPVDTLSLNFLGTNNAYRKMGFAKNLLKEADKFAQLNKFSLMYGTGIPFDRDFCIFNKTLNEWGFIMQYQKTCTDRQIEFDPLGAVINLALFYKRLGFDIYPMQSGYFIIEKHSGKEPLSKDDSLFLKVEKTALDDDAILFER